MVTNLSGELSDGLVEAISRLAVGAAATERLEPGRIYYRNGQVLDLRDKEDTLAPGPRRKRGTVVLQETASFNTFVGRHIRPATVIYADRSTGQITAVLNDHEAHDDDREYPGWCDHRAVLRLQHTPEWLHWAELDGKVVSQTDFAEHIEDGLPEIIEPPAAAMLDLAQHFQAHKTVSFQSERRLASGQVQLGYRETLEAQAGAAGNVTIPAVFRLRLAAYEGGEPVELVARLRYRIPESKLLIGYILTRPHDVLRAAFAQELAVITTETGLAPLLGTPPILA